jgi:hypothetical protein
MRRKITIEQNKITIEQKLHKQSEEAKKRGRKTSLREGARSPREKGPAAKDRLANRSMDILASVAAAEIAPPPRLAPHRSSYGSTQAT